MYLIILYNPSWFTQAAMESLKKEMEKSLKQVFLMPTDALLQGMRVIEISDPN